MVEPNTIPELMDSTLYTASIVDANNTNDPIFLERALYLHDHGYFKELTTLELRDKLRELYRKKIKVADNDVWK